MAYHGFRVAAGALALGVMMSTAAPLAASEPTQLGKVTYAGFVGSLLNVIEQTAIQKGFFNKYGLEVEFVGVKSAPEMASALMGGSAQFGVLSPPVTVPLDAQGECFSYKTAGSANFWNVIARAGVDLPNLSKGYPASLADIKGKTVGVVAIGSSAEYFMTKLMAEAGLQRSDATLITTGGVATSVAALQQGQIDFLLSYPPIQQVLKPEEFTVVADLAKTDNDALENLVMGFSGTTCEYAQSNPKIVKAYCSGVWDAYDYATDPANADGMAEVVAQVLKVEPSVASVIWRDYHTVAPSPLITQERWNNQHAYLAKADMKMPDYATKVDQLCAVQDPRK